jgi:hypothetical protein
MRSEVFTHFYNEYRDLLFWYVSKHLQIMQCHNPEDHNWTFNQPDSIQWPNFLVFAPYTK